MLVVFEQGPRDLQDASFSLTHLDTALTKKFVDVPMRRRYYTGPPIVERLRGNPESTARKSECTLG